MSGNMKAMVDGRGEFDGLLPRVVTETLWGVMSYDNPDSLQLVELAMPDASCVTNLEEEMTLEGAVTCVGGTN